MSYCCRRESWRNRVKEIGGKSIFRGEKWDVFSQKHGDRGRDMVLMLARECTGMTLRAIGEAAGGIDYVAVGEAIKRIENEIKPEFCTAQIKIIFRTIWAP